MYVLESESTGWRYTGQCQDIDQRLRDHNGGKVPSTRVYRPWRVIHVKEMQSRSEAMKRERRLKSGIGRQYLKGSLDLEKGSPPACPAAGGTADPPLAENPSLSACSIDMDLSDLPGVLVYLILIHF